MSTPFFLAAFGFFVLLGTLVFLKRQDFSFSVRVLSAMAAGLLFGGFLQFTVGHDPLLTKPLEQLFSLFGHGYIKLLQMIVIPLIFVAILASIININQTVSLSAIAPKIIGMLMLTVGISGLIGVLAIYVFQIDIQQLTHSISNPDAVAKRSESLFKTQSILTDTSVSGLILSIIPRNIFEMFTGGKSTDSLSTVLFAMFLGYSILQARKYRGEESVGPFVNFIMSSKEVVMGMVREILKLTPYAVLALMSLFMLKNSLASLLEMGRFILASYSAIIVMLGVHLAIVAFTGLSPLQFIRKIWPVLVLGFTSRSSMAAVPFNVDTQTRRLGVDDETANMSASFGTSIGQNGCAGIYPAMVAIMAAQSMGITIDLSFVMQLIAVIVVTSFGIAGVGGGATFAAISVLTIMGLDIAIVAILVSIEAVIDMARTALNISGSMLSGLVTAKHNGSLDEKIYRDDV